MSEANSQDLPALIGIGTRRRRSKAKPTSVGAGGDALESQTHPEAIEEAVIADLPAIYIKGRTARDRVAQWIALRTEDPTITYKEAGVKLGVQAGTLRNIVYRAVKEGWLKFEDPFSRIEFELIPKTIDNLNKFLSEGDKQVTIETAKGTIFREYQERKGISEQTQNIIALKIEMPPDEAKIVVGHVVGKPRAITE